MRICGWRKWALGSVWRQEMNRVRREMEVKGENNGDNEAKRRKDREIGGW